MSALVAGPHLLPPPSPFRPCHPQALHLLGAMWEGGPTLTPDAVSYNTAIKACANAFQLARALELYHDMAARCEPCTSWRGALGTSRGGAGGARERPRPAPPHHTHTLSPASDQQGGAPQRHQLQLPGGCGL